MMKSLSKLKRIVLPKGPTGRFIQIYIENKPFFRAVDIGSSHPEALAQILKEADIPFAWIDNGTRNIPSAKGEDYHLVGAGIIGNVREKEFILSGKSLYYYLEPNQQHLDDISLYIPEGIKMTIGGWSSV